MSTPTPPTEKIKNNVPIGNDGQVKACVVQALKVLPTAKEVEQLKIEQGYKWITSNKTSKLVHPNKVRSYLKDGWHLSKSKN